MTVNFKDLNKTLHVFKQEIKEFETLKQLQEAIDPMVQEQMKDYERLQEEMLNKTKQVLAMMPERSLQPQYTNRNLALSSSNEIDLFTKLANTEF